MNKPPYQYDRYFKFKINEDTWWGFIITAEEAVELDEKVNDTNDGFGAITVMSENCLFLVEGYINKNVIAHELIHLYTKYFYLNSADISVIQYEEIIAEFFEENLEKFMRKRNSLYKKFKQLEAKYR